MVPEMLHRGCLLIVQVFLNLFRFGLMKIKILIFHPFVKMQTMKIIEHPSKSMLLFLWHVWSVTCIAKNRHGIAQEFFPGGSEGVLVAAWKRKFWSILEIIIYRFVIFSATCLECKEKTLCGRFGFNLCVDNRSCFDKFCLTNDLASRKRKMECRKRCSGDAFALSLHIQRCKHRTNSYPNCIDNGNSSFWHVTHVMFQARLTVVQKNRSQNLRTTPGIWIIHASYFVIDHHRKLQVPSPYTRSTWICPQIPGLLWTTNKKLASKHPLFFSPMYF